MKQAQFRKLRINGQIIGSLILLISISLMIMRSNGLYLLFGYLLYWIINYGVIHGYIGTRYVRDD
jgi:hypothetical protein